MLNKSESNTLDRIEYHFSAEARRLRRILSSRYIDDVVCADLMKTVWADELICSTVRDIKGLLLGTDRYDNPFSDI